MGFCWPDDDCFCAAGWLVLAGLRLFWLDKVASGADLVMLVTRLKNLSRTVEVLYIGTEL